MDRALEPIHGIKFPVYVPEYYTKIPSYFTTPKKLPPPMLNGMPATTEEMLERDPTYVPQEEFIPEMIYTPMENNLTFSFKSVVEIFDAYSNDVNVVFKDPHDMPKMVELIYQYLHETVEYAKYDQTVKMWNDKLLAFTIVLNKLYKQYVDKRQQRLPHTKPKRKLSISDLFSIFNRE